MSQPIPYGPQVQPLSWSALVRNLILETRKAITGQNNQQSNQSPFIITEWSVSEEAVGNKSGHGVNEVYGKDCDYSGVVIGWYVCVTSGVYSNSVCNIVR